MPAGMIMPLTFATFFICSVKEMSNYTQRTCVNFLLTGIFSERAKDGGAGVLVDSECTNYVKGMRKLSAEIQIGLGKLTLEGAVERLKGISIRNLTIAANALSLLVNNSSLSVKDKEELLMIYREGEELIFIARVFLRSVKEDNRYQITKDIENVLIKYREYDALSNDKVGVSAITASQKLINEVGIDGCTETGDDDIGWMSNFVPASQIEKPIMPSDYEVVMRHDEIKLPKEFSRMVYILKPALMEAELRKYSMKDFLKVLDIDSSSISIQEGRLEYWRFEGKIDSVVMLLKSINFSDVCGFVVQPVGVFELSQIEEIEKILRGASNFNVKICTPLIFKHAKKFILLLLIHRGKRKTAENEDVRIYDRTRKV